MSEYENWTNDEIAKTFEEDIRSFEGIRIIFAAFTGDCYEGSAFVLFERGGKLYEVNGSHCSCFGFEDQWDPEEASIAELRHRMDEGTLGEDHHGDGSFTDVLREVLDRYENRKGGENERV